MPNPKTKTKWVNYPLRVVKKKDGTMEWRDDDPIRQELHSFTWGMQDEFKQFYRAFEMFRLSASIRNNEMRRWIRSLRAEIKELKRKLRTQERALKRK
jgi:hypothetical protein